MSSLRGHRLVIVGGGDGTISSVVDLFAYRNVVFGLLPLGTANSFAKTLSIPLDVEGAVEVIVNGKLADRSWQDQWRLLRQFRWSLASHRLSRDRSSSG
jgi:predicted polyphosphate/ATP-dependent NAD kinase